MEHILLECDAPSRTQAWKLANELWRKIPNQPLPSSYRGMLGCRITHGRLPSLSAIAVAGLVVSTSDGEVTPIGQKAVARF